MDYQEISTIVMTFIALQVSEGFVQRGGERLFERMEDAIQNVRQKLKGDTFAEQTLEHAIEKPESEERRAALQQVLIEKMERDNSFFEILKQLIQYVKQADTNQVLALSQRSVAIGGDVKESTIITGDNNLIGGISQSITASGSSSINGVNQIAKETKEIEEKE